MSAFSSIGTVGLLLLACGRARPSNSEAIAAEGARSCQAIEGIEPLIKPGAVLVFGEMHGTSESPRFIASAACAALRLGAKVTVALEVPTSEQQRISEYVASAGTDADRARLIGGEFWHPGMDDGRRSEAMVDLIDRIRGFRRAGMDARIFAFDVPSGSPFQGRDRHMADSLAAVAQRHSSGVLIVLVGNVHAALRRGVPWDSTYIPMANVLAERVGTRLMTFDMRYDGGTAWQCRPKSEDSDAVACMVYQQAPRPGARRWSISASPTGDGRYSGVWGVGTVTASPPVKSDSTSH